MPSKNPTPFLVQKWEIDGWTDGWSTTEIYYAGQTPKLLMLKKSGYTGDGKNVHIHQIRPDSTISPKLFTKSWSEGWTTAKFYRAGNFLFLFLLKEQGFDAENNNVHIHRVLDSGDIGEKLFEKRWTEGWTHAQFYSVGARLFLFLLKVTGTGKDEKNVHIHEVKDNGDIGEKLFTDNWTEGWTTAELYTINNSTFLFLLKEIGAGGDGKNVHIHKVEVTGEIGDRLSSLDWSAGWSTARFFEAEGRNYLFLLKASNGEVHIHNIQEKGKVGELVCAYDRDPGYTKEFGTGSMAPRGPVPWTSGWSHVCAFKMQDKSYLFCLKQQLSDNQEKRVKLYAVNPMVSTGPMITFMTDSAATIWVGDVGGALIPPSKISFRSRGMQTEVSLTFEDASKKYYAAGVASLNNLTPSTLYEYEVYRGANSFGRGSFKTAPSSTRGIFTAAIASCMDCGANRQQPTWKFLEDQHPDLIVLSGDNVYSNTTMTSMIWAEHLQQRGIESFAHVVANIPIFATWDDHDFGPNNSSGADRELKQRDESASAFRNLFPGAPFPARQGIYYKFKWGNVEFFMLDVRYFRTHYSGNPLGNRIMGEDQWAWLKSEIKNSAALFKVIVSGTAVHDAQASETWLDDYLVEWGQLAKVAADSTGVCLVTGDVHNCYVQRHAIGHDRHLWEFVSSGIGKDSQPNEGFTTLMFDTSEPKKEKIVAKIFRKNGTLREEKTVLLTEM
jgi:hypothetical protein